MELVVAANILLSAFLKDSKTREMLLDVRLRLFTPEYLLDEVSKNLQRSRLKKRIALTVEEVRLVLSMLMGSIQTIPLESYKDHLEEALNLAPHSEDAPY